MKTNLMDFFIFIMAFLSVRIAQSAGAIEYTDCFSAEG